MANMLTDDQWHDLVIKAAGDDGTIDAFWDTIWPARVGLDDIDPSGFLRYYAVLRDGIDLLLGPASQQVSGSDGGGMSGSWGDYFTHLQLLRKQVDDDYLRQLRALAADAGVQVAAMNAYTLTPTLPGLPYPDPSNPYYQGDPRYHGPMDMLYPGRVVNGTAVG